MELAEVIDAGRSSHKLHVYIVLGSYEDEGFNGIDAEHVSFFESIDFMGMAALDSIFKCNTGPARRAGFAMELYGFFRRTVSCGY